MKFKFAVLVSLVIAAFFSWDYSFGASPGVSQPPEALIILQGKILDSAGSPLGEADIVPYVDGKVVPLSEHGGAKNASSKNGLFRLEIPASKEKAESAKWEIKVKRSNFQPSQLIPVKIDYQGTDANGIQEFVASATVQMKRYQGPAFWIALVVFLAVYVLIAFEILHRTLAAFIGATLLLVITHTIGHFDSAYSILTYEQALVAVDWNVVFLLMGMMIIVGVLKASGVFQWMAYKSFQVARGNILLLASALCVVTAVLSAFLDNVTTMLLLTPVTLEIAVVLGISPFVFLMPEILASNFGGTATLIGDPPNIMIGSYAGITFNEFIVNLAPVVVVVLAFQLVYNKLLYGRAYNQAKVDDVPKMIHFLKEKYKITDKKVLTLGGSVLLGVVLLFILHGVFHMEVSVAALFGAALIVFLCKMDIIELLEKEIEWPSLIFFIMLFIVVGGAEQTGILQVIADWMKDVCQGKLWLAILIILWVSGIASAIVDNIPYTATMLPIIVFLNKTIPGAESGVLWWALALGACFGGNGSIIGASANVVTTGIAEKAGYKITFGRFVLEAAPITVVSLVISSIYLLVFF